jgi:IMP dehydrogenase
MDTVTEDVMCNDMTRSGGIGVIHRYNSIEDQVEIAKKAHNKVKAIGVSGDYIERVDAHIQEGANKFCIDVAHGHTEMMKKALYELRKQYGLGIHIMAGNVATKKGFDDLSDWGANSIRVGIGGGSICSTRLQTGHGMPTLSSILECATSTRPAALIADGGLRNAGDISKALAAGADAVMLGSMLAGTPSTPGEAYMYKGQLMKVYRGMASKDAQIDWRGKVASLEGITTRIPFKTDSVETILGEVESRVKSALSYSGCISIEEFQAKCVLLRVSGNSLRESHTHILK